jgi:hypothetical protein
MKQSGRVSRVCRRSSGEPPDQVGLLCPNGQLVIELPDGSPRTTAASATNVLGQAEESGPPVVLDAGGWRRLRELVAMLAVGDDGRQRGGV